jgi:hypothetical protein
MTGPLGNTDRAEGVCEVRRNRRDWLRSCKTSWQNWRKTQGSQVFAKEQNAEQGQSTAKFKIKSTHLTLRSN